MVRAILAGQKTQTRRFIKLSDVLDFCENGLELRQIEGFLAAVAADGAYIKCPYGVVGDRLWVKETTIRAEEYGYQEPIYVASELGDAVLASGLRPDADDHADVEPHEIKLRSSMFMPRKFCRIELEITGIRVERLQDINQADAVAEGCGNGVSTPRQTFCELWSSIHSYKSWNSNPWVWVIEFKRVECPL